MLDESNLRSLHEFEDLFQPTPRIDLNLHRSQSMMIYPSGNHNSQNLLFPQIYAGCHQQPQPSQEMELDLIADQN